MNCICRHIILWTYEPDYSAQVCLSLVNFSIPNFLVNTSIASSVVIGCLFKDQLFSSNAAITSFLPREGKANPYSVWICYIQLIYVDPWVVCGMCLQLYNRLFILKVSNYKRSMPQHRKSWHTVQWVPSLDALSPSPKAKFLWSQFITLFLEFPNFRSWGYNQSR